MDIKKIESNLDGSAKRFCIIAAQYNADIVDNLLASATATLQEHKAEGVEVVRVPGAFEIALTALRCAETKKYAAMIALGCVIRGETEHYDLVISECARGITQVMLETRVPIAFGVLAVGEKHLAHERSRQNTPHNRGREAALAALFMANLRGRA